MTRSSKFVDAVDAAKLIKNGDTVGINGFVGTGVAEEVHEQVEKRFLETGEPRDLTIISAAGIGDGKGASKGLNHYAHEGMIKRLIGGHLGLVPRLAPLVNENKIEAYNLPQGIISQMIRAGGAHHPRLISHVGLGTYVDPDLGGGRLNDVTKEEIVEKVYFDGKPYLAYKVPRIDVAIIKASTADEDGNISYENEPLTINGLSFAINAKNNGGKVIVQVEKVVKRGTIPPKEVKIPGVFVDAIVVAQNKENHRHTFSTQFNERFITNHIVSEFEEVHLPMTERKIIARRCALTLDESMKVINYGIGMPEGIAQVLYEEGLKDQFMTVIEAGPFGGSPVGGMDFGNSLDPVALIDEPYMFDFYDGGGIDAAYLGLAQCDRYGNVNVSKFGSRIPGCGGFINISQNTNTLVFCGTFTAGGLKVEIKNNELKILQEGKIKKFVSDVEQITFSGKIANQNKQKVLYVTERAVFRLTDEGLKLIEIAPGVDLEKDILQQMEFQPIIAQDLKVMDPAIFNEGPMGLKKNLVETYQ